MAKALQKIRGIVSGEASPHFHSNISTTKARMYVADICDAALSHGVPALDPEED
jgi:hypothetical protein